ncbi:MAG: hypothetical protein AAF909_01470 [Pseudomonadota bacterium]
MTGAWEPGYLRPGELDLTPVEIWRAVDPTAPVPFSKAALLPTGLDQYGKTGEGFAELERFLLGEDHVVKLGICSGGACTARLFAVELGGGERYWLRFKGSAVVLRSQLRRVDLTAPTIPKDAAADGADPG